MIHSLMVWATYILSATFFIGIAGCAGVVIVSWISIFGDGFTKDSQG